MYRNPNIPEVVTGVLLMFEVFNVCRIRYVGHKNKWK